MQIRWLLLGSFLLGFPHIGHAWADEVPALSIDAGLKDSTVELFAIDPPTDDSYPQASPVAGTITVTSKIRNTTKDDITLAPPSCNPGREWKTDNEAIVPQLFGCTATGMPIPYTIKPGEIHEEQVTFKISPKIPPGDIHFRLSFSPHRTTPDTNPFRDTFPLLEGAPFWSQDITVQTKVVSEEKEKYWRAREKWFEDFQKGEQITSDQDGVYKRHYFSGQPYDERTYKNGKWEELYKQYYPNGQLKMEASFKDGILDGEKKEYDQGGWMRAEYLFNQGKMIDQKTYNQDGSLKEHKIGNCYADDSPMPHTNNAIILGCGIKMK